MKYAKPILFVALALAALLASSCSRSALPFVGTPPTPTPAIPASVALQIDGSQRFQSIEGFGVNINGATWNDGQAVPALDFITGTLGGTMFRVVVEEADWEQTNDNADPRSFNWDYYNPIYESPRFQSLWQMLRYFEQKEDAQVLLNIMARVPGWMGRTAIKPEAEDEWVEMVTSLVVYGRERQGLQIKLLSPINETDLGDPEGPKVEPEQLARILRKLVLRLDELGLDDVRLVVPETAYNYSMERYAGAILADEVLMDRVASFGFHNYGTSIEGIEQQIKASAHPDTTFWITEYSQWCEECAQKPEASEQWAFAAATTDALFHYLEHGATAALLYEAFDSYYVHHGEFQYWGLLAYNESNGSFTPRHRFHASAQVFRFVRPGMVRIAVASSAPDLKVLAFSDPGSGALTIVGHNPSDHPVTLTASLSGLQIDGALTLSQTTPTAQMAEGGAVSTNGSSFTAQIAATSVFALSTFKP